MPKIGLVVIVTLLSAIISLQILTALNVFPKQELIRVCPVNAISMQNGKAFIDATKCIGCKRCVLGVGAIIPKPEKSSLIPNPLTQRQLSPSETLSIIKDKLAKQTEVPDKNKTGISAKKPDANSEVAKVVVKPAHKVDPSICIGCGLCVLNCPVQAITMVNGKAVIDPDKCINCGICKNGNGDDFSGCPVSAISAPR